MSDTFTIGSLSARLVTAPPVYDPGGAVCLADSLLDAASAELLSDAAHKAARRGAALMVVPCAHKNAAGQALLAGLGYTVASSWYHGSTVAAPVFWRRAQTPRQRFTPYVSSQGALR